jgi:effector-binding domain-containing protein
MKKKSLIIVSLVVVALLCFFLFAPVTFGIKKQIIISAPLIKVANEVTDLRNWIHWNTSLKTKDSSSFKMSETTNKNNSWLRANGHEYYIVNENPADIIVKEENTGKEIYHSVFVFPDSNIDITHVVWIENLSPFAWIKEKIVPAGNIEKNLQNLKNYFENTKEYYGLDVRIQPPADTLVLTKIITTAKKDQINALADLYKDILAFSDENNLGINENTPRMADFYEINKDSVKILAAIRVNKKAPLKNNFSYMELPSHGKILTAFYEGDYAGFKKLYNNMNRYIYDKHLKPSAIPYERYLTNPKNREDSLHMKIQLCFPVL